VTSNEAETSEKCPSPKICKILTFRGPGDQGYEKLRFYGKSIILAWMHVVWAILRQNRLGVWPPNVSRKKLRKSREAPIGMMCRR